VLSVFCFWFSGFVSKMMPFDFIGNRQINLAGTWSLEHMTTSGQDVPSVSGGLVYFDFQGRCFYVKGSQTLRGKYKSDRLQHTFQISDVALDGDPANFSGTYRVEGSELLLSGERHKQPFQIMLHRSNWGPQFPLDSSNRKPMPPSQLFSPHSIGSDAAGCSLGWGQWLTTALPSAGSFARYLGHCRLLVSTQIYSWRNAAIAS
jgi:hypothetical protein